MVGYLKVFYYVGFFYGYQGNRDYERLHRTSQRHRRIPYLQLNRSNTRNLQ